MNMAAPKNRTYQSDLRREQTEDTRRRIIEALPRVVAGGIGGLSIPAVAREAGVSVPTVYRHFGSKDELLEALGMYYSRQIGAFQDAWPSGIEELLQFLLSNFENAQRIEPTLRAAMLSETGMKARKAILPKRLALMEHAIGPLLDQFPRRERELAKRMLVVLGCTATQRAFKDYLGLDAKDAAETVAWAMRRLLGVQSNLGAQKKSNLGAQKKRGKR